MNLHLLTVHHFALDGIKVEVRMYAPVQDGAREIHIYVRNLLIFDTWWQGELSEDLALNLARLAMKYPAEYKNRAIPDWLT